MTQAQQAHKYLSELLIEIEMNEQRIKVAKAIHWDDVTIFQMKELQNEAITSAIEQNDLLKRFLSECYHDTDTGAQLAHERQEHAIICRNTIEQNNIDNHGATC